MYALIFTSLRYYLPKFSVRLQFCANKFASFQYFHDPSSLQGMQCRCTDPKSFLQTDAGKSGDKPPQDQCHTLTPAFSAVQKYLFLKSEGYFEIRQGAKCKSTDFYKVYERWCLDNLEKPLAASTFIHHLKDNQKSLGIVYDDKCIGTNRGFHNVDVDLFLPVDVPSPWD